MAEDQSTGKNYFSTLPGLITAVAGLITAVGGLILILNKAGCFSAKINDTGQHMVSEDSTETTNEDPGVQDSSSSEGDFYYSPDTVKHLTRYLVYTIEDANTETLSSGVTVLNVKLKCTNKSDYEYHFYGTYLSLRIGNEFYGPEPYSPSGNYVVVPPRSFRNLEYNFKLPPNTISFDFVFYDGDEEIGLSAFSTDK